MQLALSYASEVWNESAKFEEVGNLKSFILFVWLVTINTHYHQATPELNCNLLSPDPFLVDFWRGLLLHLPLHSTGAIS